MTRATLAIAIVLAVVALFAAGYCVGLNTMRTIQHEEEQQ